MPLRILILEDDAVLRRQLRRVFTSRGCDVDERGSVAGFVEAAVARPYDACLVDLGLPDGDGLDAWARVRARQRGATAVAMSGAATAESHARALALGCVRLLAKPFDLATLLAAYAPLLGAPADGQRPNFSIR